jgi:hypothetical protein
VRTRREQNSHAALFSMRQSIADFLDAVFVYAWPLGRVLELRRPLGAECPGYLGNAPLQAALVILKG